MAMSRSELVQLARAGAGYRLAQLEAEIAAIKRAFPGIQSTGSARSGGSGGGGARGGRKRRLTPEGRRRISEMMKKRWAERRKAAGRGK
jgi:hypothetical protein